MKDEGLYLKVRLAPGPGPVSGGSESAGEGTSKTFYVEDVECEVKDLDLRLHGSEHE